VEECERVQQFERCTCINDSRVRGRTPGTDETPIREHGAQTLSTTHHHAREFGKGGGEICIETHPTGLFLGE
jgi:hypothetical protein